MNLRASFLVPAALAVATTSACHDQRNEAAPARSPDASAPTPAPADASTTVWSTESGVANQALVAIGELQKDGSPATFASSLGLFVHSDIDQTLFTNAEDAPPSPVLALSIVTPPRWMPARPGTRSCAGRDACRALVVTVRATNTGDAPVDVKLREEWHGGALPPTELAGCARTSGADGPSALCGPLYLVEHDPNAPRPDPATHSTTIAPHATASFDVRLDWSGTGSVLGAPLVDPTRAASTAVIIGLVFDIGAKHFFAESGVTAVSVMP